MVSVGVDVDDAVSGDTLAVYVLAGGGRSSGRMVMQYLVV